uniref:Maestro heat like repeat family member 1 n=1 Tax=Oryctolagus cuniculus TaxID=9986 RepID=A0A5F9DCL4_RABIT
MARGRCGRAALINHGCSSNSRPLVRRGLGPCVDPAGSCVLRGTICSCPSSWAWLSPLGTLGGPPTPVSASAGCLPLCLLPFFFSPWAVAALQRFSESALEYLANLDQAPDPTVRKDTFAADLSSAYDILFHHWLQSREAKLRLAVVEALGPMSHLLPGDKLEEQLPKLLPGVLALYKKHAEAFHVSKSLGQILEAAVSVGSRTLEVQLDTLLATLHAQICVPVESSSPLVQSNQKEVLRCFTVLACCSPDRLLAFLLPKLDTNNERLRVGSLQILRHVINSAAAQMEANKPFILSSMRLPLLDTNNKVKRAVVQVISAMAHHGYLEQPGGEAMIEYIVQQCALPPEQEVRGCPLDPGSADAPADSVRAVSVRTLYLVSTTVDRMSDVLWPHLLQFLTPVRFTGALTPLCRSLVHLALKRQEAGADAFLIQFDAHVNLPSPYAITTRLLAVSCNPYLGDGRGVASLRLLHVLHPNIHPLLGQYWESAVPLLLKHLDEHTEETLSPKEWEARLLMFLQDTLAVVSDNTWICQLSLEMCKQLPCYNGAPREKNFLYKCIGATLRAASSREVVRKHLRELLETARYQEEAEHEGLACCFGICADSHLEDTLAQLEDFVRSDMSRKSIGIFNIFKDRSESEADRVRSALVLCYGHVASQAPRELLLAKVESDILRNMFQVFSTKVGTMDPTLKQCLVQGLCMVSQAIHTTRAALDLEHTEHVAPVLCTWAQRCAGVSAGDLNLLLSSLEPALEEQAQADVVHGCLHSVMALPPEPQEEGADCQELLYLDTMRALENLLTSLLRRNMTPQGLQVMVEVCRGLCWGRGLVTGCSPVFLSSLPMGALVPFHNLGLLVGLFSPRCADLWPASRQEAVDCVHSLLYLQLAYEGFSRDHQDDVAEQLPPLKDGLVHPDPATLFHSCHSIAQVPASTTERGRAVPGWEGLPQPLHLPSLEPSRLALALCPVPAGPGSLPGEVPEIVSVLRCKLRETQEEHVLPAAQHSVYLLATQHCAAVVSSLLGSPLPFDSHTCALWRALAVEPSLSAQVLRLLLDKMSKDVPFKESRTFLPGTAPDRVATLLPLAATCALREVVSAPASAPAVLELYPQLFAALLLRVSSTVGVQLPRNLQAKERRGAGTAPGSLEPCSSAVDALRAVLLRAGSEDVEQCVELEGGWALISASAGHEEGVTRHAPGKRLQRWQGP